MQTAILWESQGDRIRCGLCPNACLIPQGGSGVCGVRTNVGGTLVATTYGHISSIAADPIEKKPVFHYHPGTAVLSIGSVGCTMRCGHCQNWRISRVSSLDDVELHSLSPAALIDMAGKYRCPGIAFTYNEPIIWIEYVRDVAQACREAGIFTVMVTNGYITREGLDVLGPLIDVWRVDLKGATDATYSALCHVPSVEPVMSAAERAKHHWGMHVEVVTNIVPTVNDTHDEIKAIASWIAEALGHETPWHITRFFPYLDYSDLEPTPIETMRAARAIGEKAGLDYVYLGNIQEAGGEDTVCPQCGTVAVRRTGYTITGRHIREGLCAKCGADLNITE